MSKQELIVGLTDAETERMLLLAQSSNNLSETAQRIIKDGWSSKLGNGSVDNRTALTDAMATCAASGLLVSVCGDIDGDIMDSMMDLKMSSIGQLLKHQAADVIAEMTGIEAEEYEAPKIAPMGVAATKKDLVIHHF